MDDYSEDEVIREVNAHGVSIVHIKKNPETQAITRLLSHHLFNRRITASTVMDYRGPVAWFSITEHSILAQMVRQNSWHT